ncbi:MAG TPA: Kdo hydroxylase family protein [Candidatus Obscuribacterales bacterium]
MLQQLTRQSYQVFLSDGSTMQVKGELQGRDAAAEFLESGGVIFFPESPFRRSPQDNRFLLSQHQKDAAYHKNIAYRPAEDKITGLQKAGAAELETLRRIMADYTRQSMELVEEVFPAYQDGYKLDFASYRPIEEQGRKMRLRARNDLIHVDSFTTRPVHGDRILRVFENINPHRARVWRTSDTFEQLSAQFKDQRPHPGDVDKESRGIIPSFITQALGIKSNCSSNYDKWMLSFHNFLKENSAFQSNCRKAVWEFPPGSAWIVYTDMVSHSVLSGQYALEQTFIVSQKHMVLPEKTPINILRKLYSE